MDWYVTLKQNQSTVVKAFGRGSAGTLSQMPKSWNVFRLRFYVLDLELAPFLEQAVIYTEQMVKNADLIQF